VRGLGEHPLWKRGLSQGGRCASLADRKTSVLPWLLTICADGNLADEAPGDIEDVVGYHCTEGVCLKGQCGDGVHDTTEESDDGEANSDAAPNACRSGCVLPRCGDGATSAATVFHAVGASHRTWISVAAWAAAWTSSTCRRCPR